MNVIINLMICKILTNVNGYCCVYVNGIVNFYKCHECNYIHFLKKYFEY